MPRMSYEHGGAESRSDPSAGFQVFEFAKTLAVMPISSLSSRRGEHRRSRSTWKIRHQAEGAQG